MRKHPIGYFKDDAGNWWYASAASVGRGRAKLSTCSVCRAEFPVQIHRAGLFCSKSCASTGRGRPPLVRADLFERWTPEESWLAGAIWSDGCLSKDRGHYRVVLNSTDRDLIDFAAAIAGLPVHRIDRNDGIRKTLYRIHFGHRDVVSRLRAVGLAERKSIDGTWPELPGHVDAFVRGFFDGNGSVGIYKNPNLQNPLHQGRLMSSITGPELFLAGLRPVLCDQAGVAFKKLNRRNKVYVLQYNHGDSLNLAQYMYRTAGPHLGRKKDIFLRGAQLDTVHFPLPQPWPKLLVAA